MNVVFGSDHEIFNSTRIIVSDGVVFNDDVFADFLGFP